MSTVEPTLFGAGIAALAGLGLFILRGHRRRTEPDTPGADQPLVPTTPPALRTPIQPIAPGRRGAVRTLARVPPSAPAPVAAPAIRTLPAMITVQSRAGNGLRSLAPPRAAGGTGLVEVRLADLENARAYCGWCGGPLSSCLAADKGPALRCDVRGCTSVCCDASATANGGRCPSLCSD